MRRWNLALLLLAVHVLPGNAAGSEAAPKEKVRMRRRGVLAWHNYQEETEDGTPWISGCRDYMSMPSKTTLASYTARP